MQYIVADLEWNGAYSKKAHGYFNEIIEIGAVRMNEQMQPQDTFHAVLRPVVSRKLSDIVIDLTNITPEELEEGTSFQKAFSAWRKWVGNEPTVLLTWSTTDLSVLLENIRYFLHESRIPFIRGYADLQAYCQAKTGLGSSGQQLGLARACEALEISDEGFDQHRALDDSCMTAAIAQKIYDADVFAPFVREADDAFYDRLNFKPYYIRDINSPLIARNHLRFRCPTCGRGLRRRGDWRFFNNAFWGEMVCRFCDKTYTARAQFRKKYDSIDVKRKLMERLPEIKTEEESSNG
jgi:DNA polymerase III epsilon subunit-like protein